MHVQATLYAICSLSLQYLSLHKVSDNPSIILWRCFNTMGMMPLFKRGCVMANFKFFTCQLFHTVWFLNVY